MGWLQVAGQSETQSALTRRCRAWLAIAIVAITGSFGCIRGAVRSEQKGSGLHVTTDYLVKGRREVSGYGAYSYVLIPRAPRSDERYVELLKAYRSLPQDEHSESEIPRIARNLTYVPVLDDPPEVGSDAWLLDHYDQARAAAMLFARGLRGRGPYILTSRRPFVRNSRAAHDALLDLSGAPRGSMRVWLEHHVRASAGPNEWVQRGAELVLLKLHDRLASMGAAADTTIKAVEPFSRVLEVVCATC